MIHAYDKLYLDKAMKSLAQMLDYAVYDLKYDITAFFDLFLSSGVSSLFESGDANTLAGRSGVELAWEVLDRSGVEFDHTPPTAVSDRSEEYWAGWALAYYQWDTSMPFADIVRCVPIKDIVMLYHPYHEMDIRQFVDHMNDLICRAQPDTNLKRLRMQSGFSQSQLAEASGVPVRTIQQYEQRQKNINKAQAEYLVMLASVLHCDPSDLLERI